jgi:cobalt-zinc-cadmium efflux system outer membrane protein
MNPLANRRLPLVGVAMVGLVAGAGCATVPKDSGFADVRSEVAGRTGLRVQWNRQTADDRAVTDAVRDLLARGVTADVAVQVAMVNNRMLQATYEDLGVAQADVVQAGLLRNPVFDASVKFGEEGSGQIIELAVVQDFLDVFQIPLRRRIANDTFAAAKVNVTAAVLDLAGRTRAAYYDFAAAQQTLELRQTVVSATEASYDMARRLHEAGNLNALDYANERALHEASKIDLADAESELLEARERLNLLMGLWGEPAGTWQAPDRLPDPPATEVATDHIERKAVERSLELAGAKLTVEAAARTLGIKRSFGILPEAEIGVVAEQEMDNEWAVGPAFALPIPLFDQGQAATASARAELERARQTFYATAVQVRSAARSARNRLGAARAKADYYRQVIVPLRQQITHETQLQFNGMFVSAFQLLSAKQAEVEAGVAYIAALRDYWVARSSLEQLLSGRLPEASTSNNSSTEASQRMSGMSRGGH